jgi:RNA polymerase sigma factor (sigma-70 family)
MTTAPTHGALRCLRRLAERPAADRLSDRELLHRFHTDRDEAAFAALVRRHGPMVLGVCRRLLGDLHAAEDACQATFLALLRQAGRPWQPSVGAWLHTVARRTALRARRVAARRPFLSPAGRQEGEPLAELTARELTAALDEELARLPERLRAPLVLCYLQGRTRDEAAGQLGWSFGTLKRRLECGRRLLRDRLDRRGLALPAALTAALVGVPDGLSAGLAAAIRRAASAGGSGARVASGRLAVVLGAALSAGLAVALGGSPDRPGPARPTDPPAAAPTDPAPERASVAGRVLDPDGKPVAGAALYLIRFTGWVEPSSPQRVATTDGAGRFTFAAALPEGARVGGRLVALAQGFAPDWADVEPGRGDLTLKLAPDLPVRGRLIDLEGRPVAGATVGVRSVSATPDGDLTGALNAFRLNPEWVGASLTKRLPPMSPLVPAAVKTDADGRFELRGIGRGRVVELRFEADAIESVSVHAVADPGFDPKAVTPTAAEKGMMSQRLPGYRPAVYGPDFTHAARPGQAVTGTVLDSATGSPIAGARVVGTAGPRYFTGEVSWTDSVSATTDAAGRFRLAGLPKAQCRTLHVEPGDAPYLDALVEVGDVAGLSAARVEVKLTRCVVVTGRVTDKQTGRPVKAEVHYRGLEGNLAPKQIPGASLYVRGMFGGAHPSGVIANTTDDGRFTLRALPGPGVILVRADPLRDPTAHYTSARIAEADRKLLPQRRTGGVRTIGPSMAADEEGFRCLDVFLAARWENGYALIDPPADARAVTADVRLDPGRTVTGRVVGPDGQPVEGAKASGVVAVNERRPTTFRGGTFTAFALDPARPRQMYFVHEGRKLTGTVRLTGEEKEPVVTMRPWAAAAGRVVNDDGTPAAGIRVTFQATDYDAHQLIGHNLYQYRLAATTDRDGRFRLEGLFPDVPVTVHASAPGFAFGAGSSAFTPAAGETKDLGEIRLPGRKDFVPKE